MLAAHKRQALAWARWAVVESGSPIPPERVLWDGQDALETRPYLVILQTGGTRRGPAPERWSEGGEESTHTDRRYGTASLSFTVVGAVKLQNLDDDADAIASQIAPYLHAPDAEQYLTSLGIVSDTVIPATTVLAGGSQTERRAAIDVTFTLSTLTTTEPGTVATVVVDVTTEPPGLISSPQTIGG